MKFLINSIFYLVLNAGYESKSILHFYISSNLSKSDLMESPILLLQHPIYMCKRNESDVAKVKFETLSNLIEIYLSNQRAGMRRQMSVWHEEILPFANQVQIF